MKKGFTLSESLITLAIIGVISAILIPILNNVRPDQNRVLYKKAMYTLQNAVSTAIDDRSDEASNSDAYFADDSLDSTDFCKSVSDQMNIVGNNNCTGGGDSSTPNFTTTNGAKWWGLGGFKFDDTGAAANKDILVDVNGNSGDNTLGVDQLRMRVNFEGRVSTDPSWTTENGYLADSIKFTQGTTTKY